MQQFSYEYFSGANIKLKIKDQEIDAVGISYQVTYSKQPVYSYYSNKFDAVLEGKHIVQGRFVVNFKSPLDIYTEVSELNFQQISEINAKSQENNSESFPFTGDFSQVDFFDIEIKFTKTKFIKLKNCFIMGHGQSIQIDDNVILTEYNFIGREIQNIEMS
jgi:hypothetical protein